MSTGHNTKIRVVGATGLLAVLAACGSGGSGNNSTSPGSGTIKGGPGVDTTAKTIALGVLTPLSGPVALIGKPLTNGQVAYFNSINAGGGIDGYKVNLVQRDDQYSPQLHVQFFNEILSQVAMFGQSLGSPTTLAIQSSADSAGIVVGAATQSSSWVTDKVMAVIGTPYAVDVANGVDYIVNQQGKKSAKIGIVYQNDEYGADGIRGYDAAKSAYGFTDVARAPYGATDTSFTSQVLAMKNAGAEYVFLTATPTPAATIIGTAASLKYFPTWVLQGPAWSEYLMTKNGTNTDTNHTPVYPALAAGTTWVLGYEAQWGDTNTPGMAKFLSDTTAYGSGQIPDYYYMYGYALAKVEAAILKKAIESGDLSRQGILNAKLNLGTVDLGGLLPSVTYTPSLGPVSRQTNISVVDPTVPGFLKPKSSFFESDAAKNMKFGS
ncbi:MAG TPA: ABC transporter substrate-binding protein [Candidatus Angelobacter sp.]|nr:ABC transporter substrate-binding protein [Candidatus Angelobacter sp.]